MARPRRLSWLLCLPLLVLLMGARQVPFNDPAPVPVPAGVSLKDVTKSVKVALIGRTWTIADEQPGHIVAAITKPDYTVKIDLTFDDKAVNIKYLDSTDLMYEEKKGQRMIHRNYLNWIQYLSSDISKNLQLTAP
jgi:hypothetical protein